MTRVRLTLSLLLAITPLATGCASAPSADTAPARSAAPDCDQLGAEIAASEEARRAGLEQQKGAWKVVIPFAVAARYASGKAAATQADQRLDDLNAEFARQGCTRRGT